MDILITDARGICIPFPPTAEQRRIVAKVDELMALMDALETQLPASQAKAAQIMKARRCQTDVKKLKSALESEYI